MTAQPTPKGAWKITFLLFLFMLVNFADKIVVGLAGVPIMTELKLEPQQFGLLGSSFFFLFSISAVVIGFIVNSVATRWVLLALALVWALAQFPMVGTVGLTTLLICRIVLGAGEGPAFSVAAHAIYKWFPDEKRTLPTAILSQGSAFGVIVAVPALNWSSSITVGTMPSARSAWSGCCGRWLGWRSGRKDRLRTSRPLRRPSPRFPTRNCLPRAPLSAAWRRPSELIGHCRLG
jgi:MFS family permease